MNQPKPQLLKLIDHRRAIKTKDEVFYMANGANIISDVFESTKKFIKVGMTELEVAMFLEKRMARHGVKEVAFSPIVASGKNSSNIHHWPSKKKIQKGDQVMIDFGAVVHGYCSDMTRMIFMGTPSKKQEKIYNTVLKAQIVGVKRVRAGVTGGSVDVAVRKILKKEKLDSKFTHGLGHGVGRYIHEWPRLGKESNDVLQSKMVVTVEPGVYIKGWGGIRIEDMVLVTKKGCKVLTSAWKDLKSVIVL